jgi:hypothetical protein
VNLLFNQPIHEFGDIRNKRWLATGNEYFLYPVGIMTYKVLPFIKSTFIVFGLFAVTEIHGTVFAFEITAGVDYQNNGYIFAMEYCAIDSLYISERPVGVQLIVLAWANDYLFASLQFCRFGCLLD